MKTIKIIMLLFICCALAVSAKDKKKNTDEVCFTVSMSCNNCKAKIEKNITWEKGVKDLKINVDNKSVCIVYETRKTTQKKLKEAIEKLDFTCEIRE